MIKIKVTTEFPDWPLLRQTSDSKGVWGNCQFFVDQYVDACDWWVVYNGLLETESTICPPENTILITGEPPGVRSYDPNFLNQFGAVITSHRNLEHGRLIHKQQCMPWMVGARFVGGSLEKKFSKDYNELKAIDHYEKSKLISVICSDKAITAGHKRRLEFVKGLKVHFGDDLDFWGTGINKAVDKWDAIAPYKYHIAIENCSVPDYWTEKLSDAFLAGAYPLYCGAPNLCEYFPSGFFTILDVNDLDGSIMIIEDEINKNRYEASINKIMSAKNMVLDKYNFFPWIVDYCSSVTHSSYPEKVSMVPEATGRKKGVAGKILDRLKSGLNAINRRVN